MSAALLPRGWQRLIVAFWLIVWVVALPLANKANETLESTARLESSDSAGIVRILRERFKSPFAELALLRMADVPSPLTHDGRALLDEITQSLEATPGVAGVLSYLESEDPTFVGRDGSALLVVGLDTRQGSADSLISRLRAATTALRLKLRGRYPTIVFRWTGEAVVNADIRRESGEETRTAELRVFPLTLLLLFIAFQSVICATLPLLCAAVTMPIVLALAVIVNRVWPMSVILISVVSMVGLGLSIDYALLIISRYREALTAGMPRMTALSHAAERGGRTVIVSGTAVAIGFAAMLLVPVNEVRSIGIGGLLVTIVSVLVATTLLPLMLVFIGPRFNMGRGRPKQSMLRWQRWSLWVGRHPLLVLVIGGLPLLMLASQAVRLRTDLPRGAWLPANVESVRALNELGAIGHSNFAQTIRMIVELPPGLTLQQDAGWRAVSRLVAYYEKDPRIEHVWAVTTLNGDEFGANGPEILGTLPVPVRQSLVSIDARAALVELLPREGMAPAEVTEFVRQIRATDPQTVTSVTGTRFIVGGVPAFTADYEDAVAGNLPRVVLSVVAATLLVLALAFRSALIPLKAVALNLVSVAGAIGATVLVFQDGYGSSLLGLAHPLKGGFPILPVLVFGAVFGLSMDYEVFLVARIADGHRAGLADGAALADGLATTGRVITLAAAVMVAVFGGFVLGDFVLVKILGFALGVAVLIDASVVRLALGPALICLAGRLNWWPGR
jgi:putative drug exporter of the RND superfamily